jgi:hypothetical protein
MQMLRNLRGEDLGLRNVDPVIGNYSENLPVKSDDLKDFKPVCGPLFLMQTTGEPIRLRFAGTLINNYFLLFMDTLGNRALCASQCTNFDHY